MEAHPIIDYAYRRIPAAIVALLLITVQAVLLRCYAATDWLPTIVDSIATIGWLTALAYLAWFVVGGISMMKINIIVSLGGILCWLAGSFMVCDIMERIAGISYLPFAETLPFRLLFGIPTWIAILLWYQLLIAKEETRQENDFVLPIERATDEKHPDRERAAEEERKADNPADVQSQEEPIDRITVKDGTRIHIIKVEELLYVQACGDYTTLVTPSGEYIKEQTMKYLEANLPADNFVRIHRSTIVNVTQISRVELFGKETYQVMLKNGVKLRVSLTGYRLLKERLGI